MTDAMCQTTGALLKSVLMLGELFVIFIGSCSRDFVQNPKKKSWAENSKKTSTFPPFYVDYFLYVLYPFWSVLKGVQWKARKRMKASIILRKSECHFCWLPAYTKLQSTIKVIINSTHHVCFYWTCNRDKSYKLNLCCDPEMGSRAFLTLDPE